MTISSDPAARMWQADDIIALLGKLDLERLPPDERRAVGEVQARAVDDWLAAYIAVREEDACTKPSVQRLIRVC
ncbi:MAG TPA: hypothetical protein VN240_02310 [Propylenella sp.]|nr:hypothetical protein [Propylenella sp.]